MFKKGIIFSLFVINLLKIASCLSAPLDVLYEAKVIVPEKDTILLVLKIEHKAANSYDGYLTIPKYGQNRLKLDKCSISGDSLFFKYDRFDISFNGKFESSYIVGTYTSGQDFNIIFAAVDYLKKRPQTPLPPFSYVSKDVYYNGKASGVKYAGTLTIPNENGKFPAVILLTGSGQQDRDETMFYHKPFLIIADYLTMRGFAVLRIDDRGVGGTSGGRLPNTTNDFANDALEAISFLKQQKNIDSSSIGLIGHSEGGTVAFIAASRSLDISFIVSLASPAVSGKEIALMQYRQGLLKQEKDSIAVNNVLNFWNKTFDILNKKNSQNEVEASITKAFKEWLTQYQHSPKSLSLMGFDISNFNDELMIDEFLKKKIVPYLYPWTRYFLTWNPHQYLNKLDIPILALNGDKDENVDADINLARFKNLADEYSLKIDIVKQQNLNHFMQTCKNGSVAKVYENSETVSPEVLDIIYNWIQKNK